MGVFLNLAYYEIKCEDIYYFQDPENIYWLNHIYWFVLAQDKVGHHYKQLQSQWSLGNVDSNKLTCIAEFHTHLS